MRPLVSIITPAWNAERFLEEHLASIQAQTYPAWEHLIVDDGSRDQTREMLRAAAARDPRIRPFFHETNRGVSGARNTALANAQGKYVAFLDADDTWLPLKLERQVAFMERTGHAFTYHQYRCIDERGALLSPEPVWMPEHVDHRGYLRYNGTVGTISVMINQEVSGSLRMESVPAEDFVLFLDLLRRMPAYGLFEDLARHRVVVNSLSSNKIKVMKWMWDIYRRREGLGLGASAYYMGTYIGRGVAKNLVHKRLKHRGTGGH